MAGDAVDLPNAEVNASSEARSERYSYEEKGKRKLDLEIGVFGNGRDEMVVDLTGEDEDMRPSGRRFTADEKGKENLTGEDEGRMPSERRFSAEEKGKSKLVIEKDWLSLGRNDDEEQIIIEEMVDMTEMDDEYAPIEGRSKKRRKSGRAKGRSEYRREADRSNALELAPKFAFFKADDDEDEEGEDPDEGLDSVKDEDWPGPFSTATNIIDGREALLETRNAGLASKKVEASKISWTPAMDRPPKKRVPPPLKDLCLKVLCENVEEIESLEGVPDSLNQVLGRMLCNSKKMSARALGLLVSGSPAKIVLTNGTWATDQIQAVLAMCNNGTLQVSSSSPSTMQSPAGTDPGASTREVQMTSSTSCQTEGTSKKDAKKKLPLSFTNQGVVVGDNAAKWKSRVGHFVRSYVPIDITDFRKTPQRFLDDVWNALKEEFDFGPVDPKIVRESLELGYSQRFRTMKVTLRNEILRKAASAQEAIEACPIGIDPGHWENFVKREFKPEVIAANLRNKKNKQNSSSSHTLGRRTYAQNNHIRQQKHPEKEICRTEDWLRAHEKPDGTPLESAKEKYLLVKAAQNKRKNASMGEGNGSTHTDLDSDELAEVFGRDTPGRVRGVGSNISRKQFLQSVITTSIVEEKNSSSYRDVKTDVAELKTTVSRVEDMMTAMYRCQCASLGHEVPDRQNSDANMTPRTETCSHSINKQVWPSPPTGCKVKLCDREGTEVARGHVVTDSTSGICHSRRVLPGERKVYVEEVLIGNALVYDGPQDGNSTMEGFVGGGYVIWLEARLEKV